MPTSLVLVLAVGAAAYALAARSPQLAIVSPAMMFTGLGLLTGPAGFDLVDLGVENAFLETLAEVTLVLILFGDASGIDAARLRRQHQVPVRLLGVGLPLTMIAGFLCALLMPGLSIYEAALVGIVLAPTDAALGQAVVSDQDVPDQTRRALNVESGLNDGLAFPVLLIVGSLAVADAAPDMDRTALGWALFFAAQVLFGPLVGVLFGLGGGGLIERALGGDDTTRAFVRIATISLPRAAYAAAELVSGNGFLAAFACGLTTGARSPRLQKATDDFVETEGRILAMAVFFFVGAALLPEVLDRVSGHHLLYAAASLTLVRMVPVALCLIGAGQTPVTVAFIGWFGPRGLASVIYLLLLNERYPLDAVDEIGATVLTTVALSVVLHGLSAVPLAHIYTRVSARKATT